MVNCEPKTHLSAAVINVNDVKTRDDMLILFLIFFNF